MDSRRKQYAKKQISETVNRLQTTWVKLQEILLNRPLGELDERGKEVSKKLTAR
jgi:hypothetical protein